MLFSETQLPVALIDAVTQYGYRQLTDVQQQVLPLALAGQDLMVCAPTGSGKTAAFGLPIVAALSALNISDGAQPKALVLVPTRELAQQVARHLGAFSRNSALRIVALFGGSNFRPQQQQLRAGVDIVVATPGRLFDHLSQDYLSLQQLQFVVLDEADRMLDLGFIRDIQRLQRYLSRPRQTLLFSATFSPAVKQLAAQLLVQPQWLESAAMPAQDIQQQCLLVPAVRKAELLAELVGRHNWQQTLVFVNTREAATRLGEELALDGVSAVVFHGDKTQGARNRALQSFADGEVRVMVATDIAARGLDIPALPRVVNMELPTEAADFIHRVGRTGRAGCHGDAITLVSPRELPQLADISALLGQPLTPSVPQGYEADAPLPERYRHPSVTTKHPAAKHANPKTSLARTAAGKHTTAKHKTAKRTVAKSSAAQRSSSNKAPSRHAPKGR